MEKILTVRLSHIVSAAVIIPCLFYPVMLLALMAGLGLMVMWDTLDNKTVNDILKIDTGKNNTEDID